MTWLAEYIQTIYEGVLTGALFVIIYQAAPVKIRPFFKWFDFWCGFYFDTKNKVLYFCPLPMVGLRMERQETFERCEDRKTNGG